MKITINTDINAPCCPCEIVPEDEGLEPILIQTDLDFPGVATTFGWSTQSVQRCKRCKRVTVVEEFEPGEWEPEHCEHCNARLPHCDHSGTDGTIDCPECGVKASTFIESARQFIEDNDGAEADDPGYFGT